MTQLVIELAPTLYERLQREAQRQGRAEQEIAQELLAERLADVASLTERDRATAALKAAGLLAELSPEEKRRATQATMSLEEVQAAFARAPGEPLSEIVLEQRGPKE